MNLVFEKLAQFLAAGAVWRLNIGADFFRVVSADWALKVRILKGGRILGEMDGWQAGDYLRGVDFDAIEIENGATSQMVTVQIAGGGVGSDRVIGEVSVIDGGKSRTEAGISFMGSGTCGPAVGMTPHIQLWNPAGSGKKIIVEAFQASLGKSSPAADVGVKISGSRLLSLDSKAPSKKYGAGQSNAEIRIENSTSLIPQEARAAIITIPAAQTYYQKITEPFVLIEGSGLTLYVGGSNSQISASFEWFEE